MTDQTRYGLSLKPNRIMMWLILHVRYTPNTILNFCDLSDRVLTVTKTLKDNDVTNRTDAVCAENETKMLWPIEPDMIYDENYTRQWHDWLFYVLSTLKPKLNCPNLCDWVRYVIKTRQDNDVIDFTNVVYSKNETKLSWSIEAGAVCHKNKIGQWHD